MQKIILILLTLIVVTSCGSAKNKRVVTRKSKTTKTVRKPRKKPNAQNTTIATPSITQSIINNAEKYTGTSYKYGGATKQGMDCSGLIHKAFLEAQLNIPRTTRTLSTYGDWIDLKKVRKGDLLFFATKKNSRNINHVGLVTAINGKKVEFIHSTSSKGVITSKLEEKYWYFAFVQARRIL